METVVVDRWDREDLVSVAALQVFSESREKLGELLDDVFYLLLKAAPELVVDPPEEVALRAQVVAMACELEPVARLRCSTTGDPYAAALGAVELAPLLEAVLEELAGLGDDPEGALATRVLAVGGNIAAEAAEGLCEAADEEEQAAAAWGVEPGSLRHLPLDEREALSRALDSERVQRITDLYGRLRSAAFARPVETNEGWGEVVDLELGDDLARVVPAELLGLVEAGLEDVFFARLANAELAQVETVDEDDQALGGIILCVDGSDSMHMPLQGYTREMWAQAFKLLLIRQAQRQNRPLHVIDFGGFQEFQHVEFATPADFIPERILATAGAFYGGGTHFPTALKAALRVAAKNPQARADVVFVSDGEDAVSPRFVEQYRERVAELGMRTWGVLMTDRGSFPFADEQWTVADLTGGPEVAELLARVA